MATVFASPANELVVAKPFGPTVRIPDPAKGSNGWYTNEAGVTETLFMLDFEMNPAPWLAQSYQNTGPCTWEIQLKKGIRFHDHTDVTADAVKWSFTRLIDENSPVFNKRIRELLDIKQITIKDDQALVFETRKPNAAFIYDLTSPATAIISPAGISKNIFGTGPFMLELVSPKEKMVVNRFDRYWGKKSPLAKVYLNIIQNPATRMLAFESGQVDLVVNFPEMDAKRLELQKDVKIFSTPTNRLCFFFVRTADGPLADPRIRMALNYVINRREIIDTVLSQFGGKISASVFPDFLPWCNRDLAPYPYDLEKAKVLLAEAGAKDSDHDGILEINGAPLLLNAWTYEGRAAMKPLLELIQVQLLKAGIATELKVTKKGSPINRAMQKGEVHLGLQMWNVAPQGDPDFFLSNLFVSHAAANYMGYENHEIDDLVKKGKATFDPEKRRKIYNRIQEIIYNESPVIVLFHKSMITAAHENVRGYRVHPAEKYILSPEIYKQ